MKHTDLKSVNRRDWLMKKPALVLMTIQDGMGMSDIKKYLLTDYPYIHKIIHNMLIPQGLIKFHTVKGFKGRKQIFQLTDKGKKVRHSLRKIFDLKQDEVKK